jgi:hypothetical protein
MLRFNAHEFVVVTSVMARMHGILKSPEKNAKEERDIFCSILTTLIPMLDALGLSFSSKHAQRLKTECKSEATPRSNLVTMLAELDHRIVDELEKAYFFHLSDVEQKFMEPAEPLFGAAFISKFTSAQFELEEASKCFALGRSTASVFHLMRIMEIGIGAARKCLGIPDPIKPADKNWGAILTKIKDEMDRRKATGVSSWPTPSDKAFFEGCYASLDAVRVAWRNTTMHVENKYTGEEAEHIFNAVRGFMKNLSLRMDENGAPLA